MRLQSTGRILALLAALQFAGFGQELAKVTSTEAESAVISKVPPEYPATAKSLKIQGTVELEATVSTTGEVQKVNIVSGNPVLTKPASEALKKWKFRPFTLNGKAIERVVQVNMSFKL